MTQTIENRLVALIIALSGLLVLAGCGSVDSGEVSDQAETTDTSPSDTDSSTDTETDTDTDSGTDTDIEGVAAELGGVVFDDPQGLYRMVIAEDWNSNGVDNEALALSESIEFWTFESTPTFTSNLNLLDQPASSDDPSEFIELSLLSAPNSIVDFELIDENVIQGSLGQDLAVLTFTGQGLQFLSVTVIEDLRAVTATLTAEPESFEAIRDRIEPYLMSLVRTDAG